jgi:hypothetical protein
LGDELLSLIFREEELVTIFEETFFVTDEEAK